MTAREQQVLTVLAVLYAPVSLSAVAQALPDVETRPLMASLERQGLVERKSGRWQCSRRVVEEVTRRAATEGRLGPLLKELTPGEVPVRYRHKEEAMRDFRAAVYSHDADRTEQILSLHWSTSLSRCSVNPFRQLAYQPFDAQWMAGLPRRLLGLFIEALAGDDDPAAGPFQDWLEGRLQAGDEYPAARAQLAFRALLQGRLDAADRLLDPARAPDVAGLSAAIRGDASSAVSHYSHGLKEVQRHTRRRKATLQSVASYLYVPALLAEGRLEEAGKVVKESLVDTKVPAVFRTLELAVRLARGEVVAESELPPFTGCPTVPDLLAGAVHLWRGTSALAAVPELGYTLASAQGLQWMAAEYATLAGRLNRSDKWLEKGLDLHRQLGTQTLLDAVKVCEPWERALGNLERLIVPDEEPPCRNARLVWRVGVYRWGVALSPFEQRRKGKGWTAGRAVALKRLAEQSAALDFLHPADLRICACIEARRVHQYYAGLEYSIDRDRALPHLVGHPLVYLESEPTRRLRVVSARPVLHLQREREFLRLHFEPRPSERVGANLVEEKDLLQLFVSTPFEQEAGRLIGESLEVPCSQEFRVRAFLERAADRLCLRPGPGFGDEDLAERLTLALRGT